MLRRLSCLLLPVLAALLLIGTAAAADTAQPMQISVSAPGPRNLSYLPIDLITKIGADRAEGAEVRVSHTGGGGIALQNLLMHNSDFAVAGVPAIMSQAAAGGKVTILAAVDDAPLFILMVRAGLKGKVKRIADLKGRIIGVNTSSLTSKTTSQQLAELLLKSDGVALDEVRIVPAGQSWQEQSSMLLSATADAIMGDEPFASRLLAEKQVFFLADLTDPATTRKIPGAGFLHAALASRPELVDRDPRKAETMVRILRRTLLWMASHSPEQIVDALGTSDTLERQSLIASLKKYRRLYSRDGRFSTRQLQETEQFFHKTAADNPAAQALRLDTLVFDRWAGRAD